MTSDQTQTSSAPTKLPSDGSTILDKYQSSQDSKKLAAWVKAEYEKSRQSRQSKQLQWRINMEYFYGKQWVEQTRSQMPTGFRDQLIIPRKPYYTQRKVINKTRSFVRAEMSKFLSQTPSAVAVPATAEDQDQRAAYAAEQAWQSIRAAQKLRYHFSRTVWWMVVTGNGFLKTWWDQECIDKISGQQGMIRFGSVTPFHLFVPDIREQDIEDQPFVINAYTKPVSWVKQYFGDALQGTDLKGSVESPNKILDEGYINLSGGSNKLDSCIIYETWIKPGGCDLLPEGGVVIQVDDTIVSIYREGLPYNHGMYPFTKFEHIPSSTFYADSPLVDFNPLQKEYNTLRSEISEAGKRAGKPQILAQKGSIVTSRMTNEPGLIIEYKTGYPPPQWMQMTPLPQYLIDQQDRIQADMEDVSGQHDASRGQAPQGVTAGTAINYLQEKDDQFLTPQYQSVEDGTEKVAIQTLELFVQYVDMKRKIKTIGADGAFDTVELQGSDIANGTDIRIEPGSSIAESQAAKQARVMDMFSVGLIPQDMALKMMEVGGAQKILDILSVAERKAQRENIKMKMLELQAIQQHDEQYQMEQMMMLQQDPAAAMQADQDPAAAQQNGTGAVNPGPVAGPPGPPPTPPVVTVADFDIHEIHIDTHNKFRMSQEYEILDPAVQNQFELHVKQHEAMMMQKQMMNFLNQIPEEGADPSQQQGDMSVPVGGGAAPGDGAGSEQGPGAMMAGNGAVPDMAPPTGG